ncbi:hypothetical protein BHE74_00005142 [Ensete ventricosum]|nr:hypothetical protein BHE74_00005142 [Ensete ventricosum]RZR83429.1 hypothetical protein BHM03_00010030 [Ensete ventricosum]
MPNINQTVLQIYHVRLGRPSTPFFGASHKPRILSGLRLVSRIHKPAETPTPFKVEGTAASLPCHNLLPGEANTTNPTTPISETPRGCVLLRRLQLRGPCMTELHREVSDQGIPCSGTVDGSWCTLCLLRPSWLLFEYGGKCMRRGESPKCETLLQEQDDRNLQMSVVAFSEELVVVFSDGDDSVVVVVGS